MKKQLSISLIFDLPSVLSPLGFLDIGKNKEYVDAERTSSQLEEWYVSVGNAQLSSMIKSANNNSPLSVYFSSHFLEQLAHRDEKMIADIKSAVSSGSLTLLGGLSLPTLASVYSEGQFSRQILSHKKTLEKYFGVSSTRFYNSENIYCQRLDELVSSAGYGSIFAGAVEWYLSQEPNRRIFDGPNELKILLLNNPHDLLEIRSSEVHNCFFQADSNKLSQLGGLAALIRNAENVADVVSIDDQLKKVTSAKTYNIKNPIAGSIHGFSLDAYNGNVLQNQILKQYYQLESKLMALNDEALIKTWDQLGHTENIRQLGTNTPNQASPHAAYSNFSNLLTDLEIRIAN
jgi:hypothetical protein